MWREILCTLNFLFFDFILNHMEIEIRNLERLKVVSISGDLNAATSPEAESKIQQAVYWYL